MRIGIDCRLPYYQMGGISQYTLQLLPALAEIDEQNEYIIFHSRKDNRSYIPPGAPNFERENLWTPSHHRLEKWTLTAELLPYRLDIWHSPDFIPPLRGGKHQLITVHDLNFIYFPQFLTEESRRYYSEQIEWAVKTADYISADSENTRQDLINLLNVSPSSVSTIYLAANKIFTEPPNGMEIKTRLDELGLKPGFILFVGTLEPRKNIPLLLQAYRKFRNKHPEAVPLILVGRKGWLFDEIFLLIESLGLKNNVRHLSDVNNEKLAKLYSAAGVLVLPSFYEGFGLPPLEAMHCGCPVIVSDKGSLPEIVGEAGIVITSKDPEDWAEAIERVLFVPSVAEHMMASGIIQAEKFKWEITAQKTLDIYNRLYYGKN